MDSTILYPKGKKIVCVSHGGSDKFWKEFNTPEIGEICTIKAAFKGNDKYYYELYEYYQLNAKTSVMFSLEDFEPFEGKIYSQDFDRK